MVLHATEIHCGQDMNMLARRIIPLPVDFSALEVSEDPKIRSIKCTKRPKKDMEIKNMLKLFK